MRRVPTLYGDQHFERCDSSFHQGATQIGWSFHHFQHERSMKAMYFLFVAMMMAIGSFAQLSVSSNFNYHAGGPNASGGQWVSVDEMILGGSGNAPLKINLDQVRNGAATAPLASGAWVNGNLNGSQAHYAEKWSIPYRLTFTGLPTGTHTVVIEWDIRAGGKNALDYITQYELLDNAPGSHLNTFGHGPEPIDPTVGFPSFTKTDGIPVQINAPSSAGSPKSGMPTNSFSALPPEKQKMTIFGGAITAMDYFQQGSLTAAASTSSMTITFTNTSTTVILAWGGHIASEEDWDKGNSASSISGSPYHMRLLSVDGSGGNQDRSLSADAVLDPPPCTLNGPSSVECGTQNSYTNTVTDLTGYTFTWTLPTLLNTSGATFNGSTSSSSTVSVNSGTAYSGGTCGKEYTVRFTVFKNGVEVSHCDYRTTVVDTHAPTLKSGSTLPGGAQGNVCKSAAPTAPTAASIAALYQDNCGTPTATLKSSNLSGTNCAWTATYVYTISDGCNSFDVNVVYTGGDTESPVLKSGSSLPGGAQGNVCKSNAPTAPGVATIAALYQDNCSTPTATLKSSDVTGTNCSWTATYVYTISDGCTSNNFDVNVVYTGGDTESPTLKSGSSLPGGAQGNVCKSNAPTAPGVATIAALYQDNCSTPTATLKSSDVSGDNCSWTATYVYTISDGCNSFDVNVIYTGGDTEKPTLKSGSSLPGGAQGNVCKSNAPTAPTTASIAALYQDNCGTPTATLKSSNVTGDNCAWTATYIYTIGDGCAGNSFDVTVTYTGGDTEKPTLKSGSSLPGGAQGNVCKSNAPTAPSTASIAALYQDNCGTPTATLKSSNVTGDNCSWTATYVYTIGDGCTGNSFDVNVVYTGGDTQSPTLKAGSSLPGGASGNLCKSNATAAPSAASIAALYQDNCATPTATLKSSSVTGTDCNWTATYVYTISDGCVNNNFDVNVVYTGGDTESPVITSCPADITIECTAGSDAPSNTGSATATDNCGTVTPTYNDVASSVGCTKVITRTWTATDGCGHTATCVQKIIVRDRTAPVFNCVTTGTPTATDNCTSQANLIVYFKDNGNIRTWTAIDESGNIGTCQQTLGSSLRITGSTNTQVANTTLVDPNNKKSLSKAQGANTSQVQVRAYPNPFKDQIQFVVTSPVSGKGSLDVYNALGQKIRTVYQGNINKGTQSFELHLSQRQVSNLVYVLRVGGQQVSGKILQINQ